MKKATLSGLAIVIFVLILMATAVDTQNSSKVASLDNKEIKESGGLTGDTFYAAARTGDPLPLQSWGSYEKVDLAGESYFAGYLDGFLYYVSSDKELAHGELSKILQNNRKIQYIGWDGEGTYNLMLDQGYELALKSIDFNGNKLYIELSKEGAVLDSKVLQPIKPGFTIADQTYYYKTNVGSAQGIATIAVHIQTIVGWASSEATLAVVDGVWQISDTPTPANLSEGDNTTNNCCSTISPISLDFPNAGVPIVVKGVLFTILYKDVKFQDGSLWCIGSEELSPGIWQDAAAEMDFQMLPCKVCKITAEVNGHGPEAKLEGQLLNGGSVVATAHDRETLTISALPGNPFVSAILSGQEAEWMGIRLE